MTFLFQIFYYPNENVILFLYVFVFIYFEMTHIEITLRLKLIFFCRPSLAVGKFVFFLCRCAILFGEIL